MCQYDTQPDICYVCEQPFLAGEPRIIQTFEESDPETGPLPSDFTEAYVHERCQHKAQ